MKAFMQAAIGCSIGMAMSVSVVWLGSGYDAAVRTFRFCVAFSCAYSLGVHILDIAGAWNHEQNEEENKEGR